MKSRFNSYLRKMISVVMVMTLLIALVPSVISSAADTELAFGVISDIHYLAEASRGSYTDEFVEWALGGNKQYLMLDGLLDSALAGLKAHKDDSNLKYLLVPGDLTYNGEYDGHSELAEKLEAFEAETGIQVLVINGNHDINNHSAKTYENDYPESARSTTPEEFREIYANLGYDLAVSTFTPPTGTKAGMLSYSVSTPDGYRFILMDGGKYSADSTSDGEDSHETGGNYTPELMGWILGQIAEAKAMGETVVGVTHWSTVPHNVSQATMMHDFPIDNFLQVSETFADAGMHYVFTGHSHSNDISSHISDNGNIIYDCQTNSLVEWPNYFREVSLTTDGSGEITADYKLLEVDCVLPITDGRGTTYDTPFRTTASFNYTFGNTVDDYAMNLLKPLIKNLFGEITEAGGLVKYLALKGIDIEGIMKQYVGDGIVIDGKYYVSPQNVMAFVNDLGSQIDEKYINDVDYTLTTLSGLIHQITSYVVSEYPCDELLEEYGYGSSTEPGTFGDAVMVTLRGMWGGDEDLSSEFMTDVLYRFRNDNLAQEVFDLLYDVIVQQLLQDEILSGLNVNVDTVFDDTPYPAGGDYLQLGLDMFTTFLGGDESAITSYFEQLMGNYTVGVGNSTGTPGFNEFKPKTTTYLSLVNAVLGILDTTGVLEGGDVNGVVNALMEEYITQSQYDAWGETFAWVIEDMGGDNNPGLKMDSNVTLVCDTEKYEVELSQDNYRLPSLISVSLGEDSGTTRNISWYTKYSLTADDIELIPCDVFTKFSGVNSLPAGVTATKSCTPTVRTFPGIDLGVIGLLDYSQTLNRHIIKLEGLKPGSAYMYRIGDAERDWWSDTGIISTADGTDSTTVISVTDSQAQNAKQYGNWASVLNAAYMMYPSADVIVHAGDMVDSGNNLNMWKDFFNEGSDVLMSLPLMPVAGNHEAKDDYALDTNFVLPDSVEQDTATGYYYSYDYNNIHFIMLNTNDTTDSEGLSAAQVEWMRQDALASDAPWKVVVMHKAVYSNGSHYDDKEVVAMRAQFATLMPELGIDVVLQGHDHVYLRTGAMKNNAVTENLVVNLTSDGKNYATAINPDGTFYAIQATAGVKFYKTKSNDATDELFPRAEKIVDVSEPLFTVLRAEGDTLYYDAYGVNGTKTERMDSFAIKKTDKEYILLGDLDFDGDVDTSDARNLLRYAVGLSSLTEQQYAVADIDGVNAVDTSDARLALRIAVGLEYRVHVEAE